MNKKLLTKKSVVLILAAGMNVLPVSSQQKKKDYPIQPVAFTHVHVNDKFWAPKMEVNVNVTIPYTLQKCEENGRIDNFQDAAITTIASCSYI